MAAAAAPTPEMPMSFKAALLQGLVEQRFLLEKYPDNDAGKLAYVTDKILTSSGLRYCPAGKHPVPIVASATIGGRAIMDSYGGNINWEGNGEGQPIYAYRESAMACCPANYSIAEPSPVQGQDAIWCRNGMASLQQNAPLATRQAPATGLRRFLGFKLDHDDQVAAADDSVTAYTADGFDAAADGEPFADAEDGADAAEASGAAFADADAHDAGILALAGPAEQLL